MILSHGQATVEKGLSVNGKLLVENLHTGSVNIYIYIYLYTYIYIYTHTSYLTFTAIQLTGCHVMQDLGVGILKTDYK